MKMLAVSTTLMGALLIVSGARLPDVPVRSPRAVGGTVAESAGARVSNDRVAQDQALIDEYCVRCHSERRLRGNLSLENFDVSAPHQSPATAEKMQRLGIVTGADLRGNAPQDLLTCYARNPTQRPR